MAADIHLRSIEEDFDIAEVTNPLKVDVTSVRDQEKNAGKGLFKLSLSVIYFFLLVYFLAKLLV